MSSTIPIKTVFANMPRTPMSLGEMHQQLESEQEAQVNRLLLLIKDQQDQLSALKSGVGSSDVQRFISPISPMANDVSLGRLRSSSDVLSGLKSRRSFVMTIATRPKRPYLTRSTSAHSNSSFKSFAIGSPLFRAASEQEEDIESRISAPDESTSESTEAASLGKENLMLRNRIRELEHLLAADAIMLKPPESEFVTYN